MVTDLVLCKTIRCFQPKAWFCSQSMAMQTCENHLTFLYYFPHCCDKIATKQRHRGRTSELLLGGYSLSWWVRPAELNTAAAPQFCRDHDAESRGCLHLPCILLKLCKVQPMSRASHTQCGSSSSHDPLFTPLPDFPETHLLVILI